MILPPRSKTSTRERSWSSTYSDPEPSNATPTGSGSSVGPGAGAPNIAATLPSGLSSMDAAVDGVGDRARAARVGGDAQRPDELPGRAPGGAERAQRRAADVEDVDPVAARVGHERARRSASTAIPRGYCSCPRPEPNAPQRARYLYARRRAVADDAVVGVVGDVQPARGSTATSYGMLELAGPVPSPVADVRDEAPAGVEDRQPVATSSATISREPRTARPCGRSTVPGGTITTGAGAVGREALDAVVAGVGDVDRAVRADRDPAARAGVVPAARAEVELARPEPLEPHELSSDPSAAKRSIRSAPSADVDRAVGRDRDRADRGQPPGRCRRRRSRAGTPRRGRRPGSRASTGRRRRPSRPARRPTACGKRRTPSARWPITPEAEYGQGSAPGHAAEAAAGASRTGQPRARRRESASTPNPSGRRESRGPTEFSRLNDAAIASMRALESLRLSVFVT